MPAHLLPLPIHVDSLLPREQTQHIPQATHPLLASTITF